MEKEKGNKWKVLFWVAFGLLVVVLTAWILLEIGRNSIVESVPVQEEADPDAQLVAETPKPLNHYELKGSVAAGGYTEYVPSSDYQMVADETGVTFLSKGGQKLLRCNVLEHLEARWPDPNDPALLRYRTVYEDWGYRAVFEYVEEWSEDGKTTFRLGPVAFFRIPQN